MLQPLLLISGLSHSSPVCSWPSLARFILSPSFLWSSLPASLPSLLPSTSSSFSLCPSGKSMSWSCRAHATPASGTGTTSALPMCSTCSRSLVLAGRLPSLPLSCCSSAPGHLPLAPPASACLTHPLSAPGLSLLLARPQLPSWHRARPHLTLLPSLFALWYCCLPGLCWLFGHENKHSQPCFLCLSSLSLWTWFAFGVRGVGWFISSVGPASMGLSGWGYPAKGAPAIRRTLTSGPRSESPASPPSPVRQTSQLEPGQEKLPYPSLPWGDLDPLLSCTQASLMGPAGPKLGGGAMPGASAVQGLE